MGSMRLEGLVSKGRDRSYEASKLWLKIRNRTGDGTALVPFYRPHKDEYENEDPRRRTCPLV